MKTSTAPDFDIKGWYPIGYAARKLGIDRSTLRQAATRGRRNGGLDYKIGRNGRKKFSGSELLRYYNEM